MPGLPSVRFGEAKKTFYLNHDAEAESRMNTPKTVAQILPEMETFFGFEPGTLELHSSDSIVSGSTGGAFRSDLCHAIQ